MTKICCVCRRVERGNHWKDNYVFSPTERVSHGYCPLCFDVIMSELSEEYGMHEVDDGPALGGMEQREGHRPACV